MLCWPLGTQVSAPTLGVGGHGTAKLRRKSPPPAFAGNSASGNLSSVIGSSGLRVKSGNSPVASRSDDHPRPHPDGLRISTTSVDAGRRSARRRRRPIVPP